MRIKIKCKLGIKKGIKSNPRIILVLKSTAFLFHLSTKTPAKILNIIDGMVKEMISAETAVLELVTLYIKNINTKCCKLNANWEKNSDIIKKKNGFMQRTW